MNEPSESPTYTDDPVHTSIPIFGTGLPEPSLTDDSLSMNSRRALEAVEDVSRRIEHLASTLGCLGYFDEADGPRAA